MSLTAVIPFRVVHTGPRAGRALHLAARSSLAAAIALGVALAAVAIGPRILPYRALPVLTGSMGTAMPVGSLAVIVPVRGADVAVGDVITFKHPLRPGSYVTHRVAAIEDGSSGRVFVTKGDANALPDEWRVSAAGTGWRLAFAVPAAGMLVLVLETAAVRWALLSVPMIVVAALLLAEIWRPKPREVRPAARAA